MFPLKSKVFYHFKELDFARLWNNRLIAVVENLEKELSEIRFFDWRSNHPVPFTESRFDLGTATQNPKISQKRVQVAQEASFHLLGICHFV
jgi:hypothetical protein